MRSSNMEIELQAIKPDKSSASNSPYDYGIASIQVEINPHRGISLVKVLKRTVKKSEFVLLTTDFNVVEEEISAELGLPRQKVKKMMRRMPYSRKK